MTAPWSTATRTWRPAALHVNATDLAPPRHVGSAADDRRGWMTSPGRARRVLATSDPAGSRSASMVHALLVAPAGLVVTVAAAAIVGIGFASLTGQRGLGMLYVVPVALAAVACRAVAASALAALASVTWMLSAPPAGSLAAPFALAEGVLRFVSLCAVVVVVQGLLEMLDRAATLSGIDELTRLANRRALYNRAELEIARMRRTGSPMTVAYLDIDDFKRINDRLGHEEGDAVLRDLARLLRTRMRRTDLAARVGGDEFFLLLADTDQVEAAAFFRSLRDAFGEHLRSGDAEVSVSVGVTTIHSPPSSAEDLLRLADAVMYRAKRGGGSS
ncbi:diguanylate cyclase domain-containing protein [Egicoccus sp. AB-alg6-2]|uniref:GGDEF domain-containing protein n=1 Tax=Egicoccus sp. AB-alg6-2 TaxID=3242692 RepID=UPI00359E403C